MLLAAWSPAALAGVDVTIRPPGGGSPATISTDDVQGQVDGTYWVDGEAQPIEVRDGVSIAQLLEETNTDFNYDAIELVRPTGETLRLTREQIDAEQQPVIYVDQAGVSRFLGAPSASGRVASADHFQLGATLSLSQRSQSPLTVALTPQSKRIEPGGRVTFRASATGGPEGATYTYAWNFDDGSTVEGARSTVTHRFGKRGQYQVLVTAKIVGTARSDKAPVAIIQVGEPSKSKKNRTGGGTNKDADAPESGSSDGPSGPGQSQGPSDPAAAPAPAPTPSPPKKPKPKSQPPEIATGGSMVEGTLLAAGAPLNAEVLTSAARAARDGTPKEKADDRGDSGGVSEAALGIASMFGLLGLGAGMELRQTRRRRLTLG